MAAEREGLPGGDPREGDPAAAMASSAVAPSAFFIVLRPSASELASDSGLQKIPLHAGCIAAAEREGLPNGDPRVGDPAAAMASSAVAPSAFFIVLRPSASELASDSGR